MDDIKKLTHFIFNKITLTLCITVLSINVISETFQLGDVAPRGAPDGQLNAADSLILQRIILGEIIPTNNEMRIGDVAPLSTPDDVLNAGDLVVQQRAVLGLITLGTIDISPLPAPTLNSGVSPTIDNPYLITGRASQNVSVDIYVQGTLQHHISSNPTDGTFSVDVYLYDGVNEIYAVENDGVDISLSSNIIQVEYNNIIDKNNPPSSISVNTVWTAGSTSEPYVITADLVINGGVTLVVQPGVSVIFEAEDANLIVSGSLIIKGDSENKVLLTKGTQVAGQKWNGVYVNYGGHVIIEHAIIEYAGYSNFVGGNSGVYFGPGSKGSVSNSLIQFCYAGIIAEGNTSPIIGPNNTITQNSSGVKLIDGKYSSVVGFPSPAINTNKIFNNASLNLYVYSDTTATLLLPPINARGNYWGSTSLGDIAGKILAVSRVDFSGYLDINGNVAPVNLLQGSISTDTLLKNEIYDVLGQLEITAGATLTIPKGATLRFANSSSLSVAGNLIVLGSQSETVTFTSGKEMPTMFDWSGISIKDGGIANINFAVIEYAATSIYFYEGSNGTVSNTIISNNRNGVYIVGSSPTIGPGNLITKNGISGNGNSGIFLSYGSINKPDPIIKNNQIFNNIPNIRTGYYVDSKNTLIDMRGNYWGTVDASNIAIGYCSSTSNEPCVDYSDYLDVNGNVADAPGIGLIGVLQNDLLLEPNKTYEVLGYLEVPDGITLTIPSGVKLIFVDPYKGLNVYGNVVVTGTPTNPVIFTSGQLNPAEGYRGFPGDWDGIRIVTNGTLSMEYAVIQYADAAIGFSGSNVTGSITNSIIEYAGTGMGAQYSGASNITMSNNLFRYNYTGLNITGDSSPTFGPGNVVAQNTTGIYLQQFSNLNPSPVINGNYIFNNSLYNINVNNFIGGNTVTVDVRNNYWGTDDPVAIALKMNQGSTSYPIIDFSDFILTANVPPGTGSSPVAQELQLCPVVRVTDDSNYIDIHPQENIAWIGNDYTSVQEIEKAFNNARLIDSSVFQFLKMPSQTEWDAMSLQQKGLYLINSERQARGIKPYEGINQSVVDIVQTYADFVRTNNRPFGHYEDGKTPIQRLDENIIIRDNRDASINPEDGYEIHGDIPVPADIESIVRSVYWWIYYDKFPLYSGPSWGHRDSILQTGLNENSGEAYKEGLIGFGVSSGEYNPELVSPPHNGAIVFVNLFDPSSTWDHSTTISVDTDSAQLCNNNVIISIDETSVPNITGLTALEIGPSDIFLTPGGHAQLEVKAIYQPPYAPRVITSTASFYADALSVVNINAGYITALQNGDVSAVASVNGVTSNRVFISVRSATDTTNLNGTNAENYLAYVPDNASIEQYDPKALSVFTGRVNDKQGTPLQGVIISINNNREYGSTETDINGRFVIAVEAGKRTIVYRKSGYLTLHREMITASNSWAVADDVIMLPVDNKETAISLSSPTPQIHTSTVVSDSFGSRSTTLVFNGISSATITSTDGSTRSLTDFSVRATEYELPQSMPANLPKESAFTYCSELEVVGVRDDEQVTFDNPVVMYVDNFLNFNLGEIVPIGYYDRTLGDWVASDNGIVVKLLDTSGDGLVDGLDINDDNIADDLNQNGSTADEIAGIENYPVGASYWRGSFNHFTPEDFNWPFIPPTNATGRGGFNAETSNENKEQTELECTGSYVKPETQAFHEDIPITGTNLTLHYSSQRTEGYKHKFNVQVSGDTISPSMLEMIVKLNIGGNEYQQTFAPAVNKEAEFIWDGTDPLGNRIKGVVNGLISIGFKYNTEYSSAGSATTPAEYALIATAWANIGANSTGVSGRDEFISWSSSTVSVQNTFDNQLANGWSLSNHHQASPIGNIYKGDGEVVNTEKISLILKTGIKTTQQDGDDGFYQKGGSDIDYVISPYGTLSDKVTGLEWQYIDQPEKFTFKTDAEAYCSAALFTSDSTGWRLPTNKEVIYTIDKLGASHPFPMYTSAAVYYWHQATYNIENKSLPVLCVRGEELDTRYVTDLIRDNTAEVVVDPENGLMWQDDVTTVSVTKTWSDAILHCEGLNHAGYPDWRLPNINELTYALPNTIFVNYTTIPPGPWSPSSPDRKPYWASTPDIQVTDKAWAIETKGLSSDAFNKTDLYNVRCVRDNIQSARSPYHFDNNGRHSETVDLSSGTILSTFAYDAENKLRTITDRFGDAITITGDPAVDGFYLITTQDGYTTKLFIDANNDLTSVLYDDTTDYSFVYGAGSLLESKTTPNGHVFLHQFDLQGNGRTIQTSDEEGGVWDFFSTRQSNSSALYGYTTAETNTYQTLRTIQANGDVNKVTTLFDSTQLTDLNQADDLKQTLQSCAVTTVIDKVIDSKTKEPIPSVITITQPSGLKNVTQLSKTYAEAGADTTKQTLTADLNGKISSVYTDSTAGITTTTSAENRTTTLNVDPETLLLQSSQTPGLLDTTYTYDARGRQEAITTGTRTTTFTYNPVSKGDVTYITADDGKQTQFEYDALGRVKTIIYPDTHRTENIYDNNGNMKTLVVPTPANHTFTYTAVDKVKTETTPKEGAITEITQYDYDFERNLKQITLPSTKVISNTYTQGLLDFTSTPEGIINYSYTCNGKIDGITEGTESVSYGYDGSLLKDITYAGALNSVISQTYNTDFNIDTLTYAGQTTNVAYDNDGLLTGTNGYSITRNALNGLPETLANGTLLQTRGFNGYGEAETVTTKVNTQNVYDYALIYNDLGKITTKTETLDDGSVNTYVYTYDDRRRLDTVTKNGVLIEDYGYDANGNRDLQTNIARGISAQSATYNLGDQLKTVGATTYVYDADGYLKEKNTTSGITTYQYDSQGRLLQVQTPAKLIEYKHNAIGNRVEKKVDGVVTEKYLWLNKTTLLATYYKDDVLLQRYQYTDGNTPNSFTQGGQTYYIVTDHLGTPRAITDNAGAVIKKLAYDSFGNVISDSNSGFGIPFGFSGGLQDNDTSLIRFGFRDYDPDTGRWAARDPIGFAGGDTNLYGYVFSDPVNFIDQTGESPVIVVGVATGASFIIGGAIRAAQGGSFFEGGVAAATGTIVAGAIAVGSLNSSLAILFAIPVSILSNAYFSADAAYDVLDPDANVPKSCKAK